MRFTKTYKNIKRLVEHYSEEKNPTIVRDSEKVDINLYTKMYLKYEHECIKKEREKEIIVKE